MKSFINIINYSAIKESIIVAVNRQANWPTIDALSDAVW